eukprot:m.160738 g.160738  ORF g.160738 m.160738 type:complete len:678 (-) comp14562_c0_seq1:374-2407(-)
MGCTASREGAASRDYMETSPQPTTDPLAPPPEFHSTIASHVDTSRELNNLSSMPNGERGTGCEGGETVTLTHGGESVVYAVRDSPCTHPPEPPLYETLEPCPESPEIPEDTPCLAVEVTQQTQEQIYAGAPPLPPPRPVSTPCNPSHFNPSVDSTQPTSASGAPALNTSQMGVGEDYAYPPPLKRRKSVELRLSQAHDYRNPQQLLNAAVNVNAVAPMTSTDDAIGRGRSVEGEGGESDGEGAPKQGYDYRIIYPEDLPPLPPSTRVRGQSAPPQRRHTELNRTEEVLADEAADDARQSARGETANPLGDRAKPSGRLEGGRRSLQQTPPALPSKRRSCEHTPHRTDSHRSSGELTQSAPPRLPRPRRSTDDSGADINDPQNSARTTPRLSADPQNESGVASDSSTSETGSDVEVEAFGGRGRGINPHSDARHTAPPQRHSAPSAASNRGGSSGNGGARARATVGAVRERGTPSGGTQRDDAVCVTAASNHNSRGWSTPGRASNGRANSVDVDPTLERPRRRKSRNRHSSSDQASALGVRWLKVLPPMDPATPNPCLVTHERWYHSGINREVAEIRLQAAHRYSLPVVRDMTPGQGLFLVRPAANGGLCLSVLYAGNPKVFHNRIQVKEGLYRYIGTGEMSTRFASLRGLINHHHDLHPRSTLNEGTLRLAAFVPSH